MLHLPLLGRVSFVETDDKQDTDEEKGKLVCTCLN